MRIRDKEEEQKLRPLVIAMKYLVLGGEIKLQFAFDQTCYFALFDNGQFCWTSQPQPPLHESDERTFFSVREYFSIDLIFKKILELPEEEIMQMVFCLGIAAGRKSRNRNAAVKESTGTEAIEE